MSVLGRFFSKQGTEDSKIKYKDISIAGAQITKADGSWYYTASAVSYANDIPSDALVISVEIIAPFDTGIFPVLSPTNQQIVLTSYKSMTVPSNRYVRVFYKD